MRLTLPTGLNVRRTAWLWVCDMQIDKKAHFLAGAAIAGLCAAYGVRPRDAFFIAAFAGAVKEIVDRMGYGTPDKWDFVVTTIGGAFVLPIEFM